MFKFKLDISDKSVIVSGPKMFLCISEKVHRNFVIFRRPGSVCEFVPCQPT